MKPANHLSHLSRRHALEKLALAACAPGLAGVLLNGCTPRPKSVSLWYVWRDWQEELFLEVLARFRRSNPDIQVNATASEMSTSLEKLNEAARNGTLPDVFALNSAWMASMGGAKLLADTLPPAQRSGIDLKRLLLPRDYERGLLADAMLSLPAVTSCATAMFYSRPSLLARAGLAPDLRLENWESFVEASATVVRKLNEPDDLRVIGLDPFFGPGLQPFPALAFGADAPTVTPDRKRSLIGTEAALNVARAMDAYVLKTLKPFDGYRGLLRWRQIQASLVDRASVIPLANGAQVFCIGGVFVLGETLHANPKCDLRIQPIPGLRRLHGGTNGHAWSYAMRRDCKQPDAAWKLLRFLTVEREGNGWLCARLQRSCPIADVNDWPEFKRLGPLWDGVKEATAVDVPYPTTTDQEFLRPMLFDVPLRRVGGESIDSIFLSIDQRYQAFLDATQGTAS